MGVTSIGSYILSVVTHIEIFIDKEVILATIFRLEANCTR